MLLKSKTFRLISTLIAIVAALSLAACGDDDEDTDTETGPTLTQPVTTAPSTTTPKPGKVGTQPGGTTTPVKPPKGTPQTPEPPTEAEIKALAKCLQDAGSDQKKIQACVEAAR